MFWAPAGTEFRYASVAARMAAEISAIDFTKLAPLVDDCVARSPHEAQRNAGAASPDFAALHPGYGITGGMYVSVPANSQSRNSTTGACTRSCRKVNPTISRALRPSTPSIGSIQNGLIRFGSASAAL